MSDRILFSIGEALIDMIPSRVGCSFDEVPAFSPRVGGAPAQLVMEYLLQVLILLRFFVLVLKKIHVLMIFLLEQDWTMILNG